MSPTSNSHMDASLTWFVPSQNEKKSKRVESKVGVGDGEHRKAQSRNVLGGRRLGRSTDKRAIAGDKEALGKLLRQHDYEMRALAWRMLGDLDLVDDVLQDAYLKAYRFIHKFNGESAFSTWLHRIVANSCIDCLRRQSTRNEVSFETEREPSVPPADDRVFDSETALTALLSLPFDQRVAVYLIDCEGYSYDEAANLLGISQAAIGSRLFRARSRLQAIGELI